MRRNGIKNSLPSHLVDIFFFLRARKSVQSFILKINAILIKIYYNTKHCC